MSRVQRCLNSIRTLVCMCVITLAAAPAARSQTASAERRAHASRAVLESKLATLGANSGARLPILEGFVDSKESSLDHYQQGYYQYSIQLNSISGAETQVRVSVKITAWYAGSDQANSGYRVLPSNGRLEADLLDRLERELTGHFNSELPLPDKPQPASARGAGVSSMPNLAAHLSLPRPSANPPAGGSNDEQRVQQLREQLKSLQEILKNQTRPDDLAAVKSSNTPILATPMEGAQIVLRTEAGDEFQILAMRGDWVHVRISGLSRGWMQRSQLELPAAFGSGSQTGDISQSTEPAFRRSREETSTFPGSWEPLQGKRVKIVWVQPLGDPAQNSRASYAKSVFHQTYSELSQHESDVSGVVIVFDSQDGGMAAATLPVLQQWAAGHLTDNAFWKRCWFDPADAFNLKD